MKGEKTDIIPRERDIKKLLEKGIQEGVFPGGAAGISWREENENREIISVSGHAMLYPLKRTLKKNDFFDLASLTKPLATTMAILSLVRDNKIDINDKLSQIFEKNIRKETGKIRIKNLLSHSSGLPVHRDYFKVVSGDKRKENNEYIENLILEEPLLYEPGTISLYSDLDFMLLGRIIERKSGCNLDHYVAEKILRPLNLERNIFYYPLAGAEKNWQEKEFVATENCPWRKKIICGEVHDDNCYVMGGVAGHSGLFGNIEGVTRYASLLLEIWQGQVDHPNINKEDMEFFLSRQQEIPGRAWQIYRLRKPAQLTPSQTRHF